jgi:hypothetical protein
MYDDNKYLYFNSPNPIRDDVSRDISIKKYNLIYFYKFSNIKTGFSSVGRAEDCSE